MDRGPRKRLSVGEWFVGVFAIAGVSFVVHELTLDTTGPPFHDSVVNRGALYIFMTAVPVLFVMAVVALIQYIKARNTY